MKLRESVLPKVSNVVDLINSFLRSKSNVLLQLRVAAYENDRFGYNEYGDFKVNGKLKRQRLITCPKVVLAQKVEKLAAPKDSKVTIELTSRVVINDKIYHWLFLDFRTHRHTVSQWERFASRQEVLDLSFTQFVKSSPSSYHGYTSLLLPEKKWKDMMLWLLDNGPEIIDKAWLGMCIKRGYSTLRILDPKFVGKGSRYKYLPCVI